MTLTTPFCPNAGTHLVAGQPYDPTAISAVEAQGTLLTTAGKRLRMLLAALLLAFSVRGLLHHHGGHHHDHGYGHWANATESDKVPSVIVPCSVDLSELLKSAGVTGVDASMIHREDHGCCGDEICGLGEDSENCAADCTEGSAGQLVWREEKEHRRHRHRHEDSHDHGDSGDDDDAAYGDRHRHGRRNDGSYDDIEEFDTGASHSDTGSELDAHTWLDDDHMTESETGHRRGGKRHHDHGNFTSDWAAGHGHRSAVVKKITSGVMGVVGLLLMLSIRASWIAVLRDFYTFFFPSCGCQGSASKHADTSYGGTTLEAETSDSKGEIGVPTTV